MFLNIFLTLPKQETGMWLLNQGSGIQLLPNLVRGNPDIYVYIYPWYVETYLI